MLRGVGRYSAHLLAFFLFLATAAYYVLVKLHGPPAGVAFDIYGYFLPIKMYAAQSVLDGGRGFLWTPFQSCGQPFFANIAAGLLYPPNLLFLVLDPHVAMHLALTLNMVVGAIGMLLLLRELGLSWPAVVGGALAFELGDPMAQLTGWSPMQNGSWAWVPWALWMCERLLRAPSRAGVVGLAAVLSLAVLPGWVLITALTYQVIALRIAWELITRRETRALHAAAAITAALVLMPLLVAIQLVPAAEFAQQSFRVGVEVQEFMRFGGMPPAKMLAALKDRQPPVPFLAVLLPLAAVGVFPATRGRRLALFWLLTGVVYGVLALGPATPLYRVYSLLPPGPALVRYAHRLFWITGLSMALLTAFAIDAFTERRVDMRRQWLRLSLVTVSGLALYAFTPGGLRAVEAITVATIVAAYAVALAPRLRAPMAWIVATAVLLNVTVLPLRYGGQLLPSLDAYRRFEQSLAKVRAWETAQDRVLIQPSAGALLSLALMHKSASIFHMKDIYDYDALMVQRLVEYNTMLNLGEVVHIDQLLTPKAQPGFRQRLLDVAAVRYVVTVPVMKITEHGLRLRPLPVPDREIEVYANDTALARARFVPRVEVLPDPGALLKRLAYGTDDLATLAFVEEPIASGFSGEAGSATGGTAVFARDDPEHLIIDVDAPARGFLVVADQDYPGWRATVNGVAAPIRRANYTFRLVEVPAGRSRVELRYRPTSVAIGAVVSMGALAAAVAFLWRGRRRR